MPRQIKITFSLSAELKQKAIAYCEEKGKNGISFTLSDLCRVAILEYIENHPVDNQYETK